MTTPHNNSTVLGIHHVGIVVDEIGRALAGYSTFGFTPEGRVQLDPMQKAKIQFLLDASGTFRIELLEPVGADSPLRQSLEKGGGINHIAYVVTNIEAALAELRRAGTVQLGKPVAAPAINGARIVFLFDRVRGVFELVEEPARVTP